MAARWQLWSVRDQLSLSFCLGSPTLEFVRFLRAADELQRVIQLQALALGFGGGFFFICGYSLFEPLGAPPSQSADIVVIMPLLYVVGVLNGARRYR